MHNTKVVMMGLGYIGLPTAALIASHKVNVQGIDINSKVVETVNKGEIHIVEPDLDGLVKHVVDQGYLKASTKPDTADVYIIAVPTPFKNDHAPDLSYVISATERILPLLKEEDLLILESTSPIHTTEKIRELIESKRPDVVSKIYLAYCPERVLPGNVIYELAHNDRVIGGIDEASTQKAVEFYRIFVKGDLHKTNAKTAEMCKLVENASRDVNIAFANELSLICYEADINVTELIKLANKHPRVNILTPGTGVGGHCIAVDPWFIISEFKSSAKIMHLARNINTYKTEWVIEKIKNAALEFQNKYQRKAKIACMGLAFKPNIDDLRESPSLYINNQLIKQGYDVLSVEPNLKHYQDFELVDYKDAYNKADVVAFLVAHNEFRDLKQFPANVTVLDFCGVI